MYKYLTPAVGFVDVKTACLHSNKSNSERCGAQKAYDLTKNVSLFYTFVRILPETHLFIFNVSLKHILGDFIQTLQYSCCFQIRLCDTGLSYVMYFAIVDR